MGAPVRLTLLALLALLTPAAAHVGHWGTPVPLADGTAYLFAETAGVACGEGEGRSSFEPGGAGVLCAYWEPGNVSGETRALRLAATAPSGVTLSVANATATAGAAADVRFLSIPFTLAGNATAGVRSAAANLTLLRNATVSESKTSAWTFEIAPAASPAPGTNWPLLAGVGALVAAGAVGVYAVTRKRQVKAAPRSSALQQMELEKRIEKAKAPEEVEALKEEAAAAERERAVSREAQIVEAKIRDVRTGLDRLKQRLDAGQLTRLQYDKMREKREAELEALERELDATRGTR